MFSWSERSINYVLEVTCESSECSIKYVLEVTWDSSERSTKYMLQVLRVPRNVTAPHPNPPHTSNIATCMRVPQGTLLPPNANLPLQNKKMRFVRSKRSKFTKNRALAVTLDTWKRKAKRVFRHAAFYARPANYIHNIHTYYMTGANHQVFAVSWLFFIQTMFSTSAMSPLFPQRSPLSSASGNEP